MKIVKVLYKKICSHIWYMVNKCHQWYWIFEYFKRSRTMLFHTLPNKNYKKFKLSTPVRCNELGMLWQALSLSAA